MLKNYLKIAWRNLFRNRTSSLINIGGLAAGMAVALLIGLWIHDEYSFDKYHRNYDHIARVMQFQNSNRLDRRSEKPMAATSNMLSCRPGTSSIF